MIYVQKKADTDGAYIDADGMRWNVAFVRNIRPLTPLWQAFNDTESALQYLGLRLIV